MALQELPAYVRYRVVIRVCVYNKEKATLESLFSFFLLHMCKKSSTFALTNK